MLKQVYTKGVCTNTTTNMMHWMPAKQRARCNRLGGIRGLDQATQKKNHFQNWGPTYLWRVCIGRLLISPWIIYGMLLSFELISVKFHLDFFFLCNLLFHTVIVFYINSISNFNTSFPMQSIISTLSRLERDLCIFWTRFFINLFSVLFFLIKYVHWFVIPFKLLKKYLQKVSITKWD